MSIDARSLPLPTERHLRMKKQGGLLKLVTWVCLVAIFAFVFFTLERSSRDGAVDSRSLVGPTVMLVGGVAVLAGSVAAVLGLRWQRVHNRGIAQVAAGDLAAAAATLEEAARKAPVAVQRALSLVMLAACDMQLGQVERALSLYGVVEASGALKRVSVWHHGLPGSIALCLALLGDVAQARAWLEETERRRKGERAMASLMPAVVVLLRDGHAGAAARTLDERWREAEATGGALVKAMRVLRAFALHQQDAAAHAAEVASWIAGARPVHPGELDFLHARWPQLREFLTEQGLSPRAAA